MTAASPEPGSRDERRWWADPARHGYRAADPDRPEDGCASCGYLADVHPNKPAAAAAAQPTGGEAEHICPSCGLRGRHGRQCPAPSPDSDQLRDEIRDEIARRLAEAADPDYIGDALLSGPLAQLIARDAERGAALERVGSVVDGLNRLAAVLDSDEEDVDACADAELLRSVQADVRRALDGDA